MGKITLIATLQSNVAAGLNLIGQSAQRLTPIFAGMNNVVNVAGAGVAKMNAALNAATNNANQAGKAVTNMTNAQNAHHNSTLNLIGMMIKFGIILKALQLITAPIGWITSGITSAIELDKGLRQVMSTLTNIGDNTAYVEGRFRVLYSTATNAMMTYGQAIDKTTAALYNISVSVGAMNFAGLDPSLNKTTAALALIGNEAGKDAVAGFTDIETAAKSLTVVLNGLQIPIGDTTQVSDVLFRAVHLGKATFAETANEVGNFVNIMSAIARPGSGVQDLKDVMALFAFNTQFLPQGTAGPVTSKMLNFFTNQSASDVQLVEQIRMMSQGAVKLRASDVMSQGYQATFTQMAGFFDPAKMKTMLQNFYGVSVSPQQAQQVSLGILSQITGDAASAAAALRGFSAEGGTAFASFFKGMDDVAGQRDAMFPEGEKSWQTQLDRLKASWSVTAMSLSNSSIPMVTNAFAGVANVLEILNKRPAFQNATIPSKIGMIFHDLSEAFSQWYFSEGGQKELSAAATQIGHDIGAFVMGAFGLQVGDETQGSDFKNAWYQAGKDAAGNFLRGLGTAVLSALNPGRLFQGQNTSPSLPGTTVPVPGIAGVQNAAQSLSTVARFLGAAGLTSLLARFLPGPLKWLVPLIAGGTAAATGGGGGPEDWLLGASGVATSALWAKSFLGGAGSNALLRAATLTGSDTIMSAAVAAERVGAMGLPKATAGLPSMAKFFTDNTGSATAGTALDILSKFAIPLQVASLMVTGFPGGENLFQNKQGLSMAVPFATGGPLDEFHAALRGGLTPDALAGWLKDPMYAEDYKKLQESQAAAGGNGSGNTYIFQITKLADNITASTPGEAAALADQVISQVVTKLDRAYGNTGKSPVLTP